MRPRMHQILLRVRALWLKRRLDRELAEELEFHHAMLEQKFVSQGLPADQAHLEAIRTFGNTARWHQSLRELWQFQWLENLVHDATLALRMLRRSPVFTTVAISTLTLAVGASISVFSLMDGLLLRPLPVPAADQLVLLNYARSDDARTTYSFAEPFVRGWEKRTDIFPGGLAGYSGAALQVRNSSGNVAISGAMVSGQFFSMLQVPPLLGRWLTPQDDQRGGAPGGYTAVISETFWQNWFHRTPDVIGRRLTIANVSFTVVGVMPRRFIGADPTTRPQIYVPLWAEPVVDAPYDNISGGVHNWWLRVLARRAPSASFQQVNAAVAAATPSIVHDRVSDAEWIKDAEANHLRFGAEPGSRGWSWLRLQFSKPLVAVFILCAAMLLLACLNLAGLLMARAASRQRELATRLAIGATRGRLIRQLLVESLLLASLGTAAGLAASPLVTRALTQVLLGTDSTSTLGAQVDLRMALFAVAVALVSALLVGFLPALRATSLSLNDQMKEGSHPSTRKSPLVPAVLMSLQVAIALILVTGAGLLTHSLVRLYRTGLGFEPKGLLNIQLEMDKQPRTGDALFLWYREFAQSLEHKPGVESVSYQSLTPLSGSSTTYSMHTTAHPQDETLFTQSVGARYFETMRIPLVAGRGFQWSDTTSREPVLILNASAARLLFPGQNAVGQQVVGWKNKRFRVVAVVGDVHYQAIDKEPPPAFYTPITQDDLRSYTAVVRLSGSRNTDMAASVAVAARELAARMAPEIPSPVMTTMSNELDRSISSQRMMAILSVFFAACALLVTAIGLYGTLAFATARRTVEIGVRMALGARRAQVVALVFRVNAIVAVCGSLAGLAVAALSSRALAAFLYGTSIHDPWILAGSTLALLLVAGAASLVPALRAAWIEPISAIRNQ